MADKLAGKIRESGPIRFDHWMAAALYDADAGYYARTSSQVGREGDFFTSVSAGPLFGMLLARHLAAFWEEIGRPERWRIVELGAHNGRLAEDILNALPADAAGSVEYAVIEPLPRLAAAQATRLGGRAKVVAQVGDLDPLPGILVANEVLDALPCRMVESDGDVWHELGVRNAKSGGFAFCRLGPAGSLAGHLPQRPAGYRTEVRDQFATFLEPLTGLVQRMLWIDYGYEREDYYAEGRTSGTLRTFLDHRAADEPLKEPGSRDISVHVEFTGFREAVEGLGAEVIRFENQARFLTELGRPWLLSLEGRTDPATAKLVRNFQTLTHPGQLGSRFHALELTC